MKEDTRTSAPQTKTPSEFQACGQASQDERVELEDITIRKAFASIGRLSLGAGATLVTVVLGLLSGALGLGVACSDHKVEMARFQAERDVSRIETKLAATEGELKEASKTVAYLKDLNEQKVCANFTIRERNIAVRRLKHALRNAIGELEGRSLDPAGDELPIYRLSHHGLDGLDPALFEDDDTTVWEAMIVSARIAELNNLLGLIREWDLTAMSNKLERIKSLKESYTFVRENTIKTIKALSAHLDDRYSLQSDDSAVSNKDQALK